MGRNPFSYRPQQARGYGVAVNPPVTAITRYSVSKAKDAITLIRATIKREAPALFNKEHMWSVGLDERNTPLFLDLVSLGTLNYNLVHPRETFYRAVTEGAPKMLVAHNHPSGTLEPSDEDLSLTKRLAECGNILGVELVDHLIIAREGFISLREKKAMFI